MAKPPDMKRQPGPLFELSAAPDAGQQQVDVGRLLVRRPVAVFALLPRPAVLFAAGAVAGALGEMHCCLLLPEQLGQSAETGSLGELCASYPLL
jgi:hypothetical protein